MVFHILFNEFLRVIKKVVNNTDIDKCLIIASKKNCQYVCGATNLLKQRYKSQNNHKEVLFITYYFLDVPKHCHIIQHVI